MAGKRQLNGGQVDRRTPLFIYLTHAWVYILKGCPPVYLSPSPLDVPVGIHLLHASGGTEKVKNIHKKRVNGTIFDN